MLNMRRLNENKKFLAKIMFVLMFVSIAGSSALAVRDGEYIADGEYSATI